MKYVQEKILPCSICNRDTKHFRNSTKPNWLLHLLLVIITGGLWIVGVVFILMFDIELWGEPFVCSVCGEKYSSEFQSTLEKIALWIGLLLVLVMLFGMLT